MTDLTDERLREIAAYQPLDFNITHLELISMAHELLALRKPVALSTRLKEAEKALESVRRRVKNARGAIESNQVVDKDVHGSLTVVMETIDRALKGEA